MQGIAQTKVMMMINKKTQVLEAQGIIKELKAFSQKNDFDTFTLDYIQNKTISFVQEIEYYVSCSFKDYPREIKESLIKEEDFLSDEIDKLESDFSYMSDNAREHLLHSIRAYEHENKIFFDNQTELEFMNYFYSAIRTIMFESMQLEINSYKMFH